VEPCGEQPDGTQVPWQLPDVALGRWLLASGVVRSLACDVVMVPRATQPDVCGCDPAECGWHQAGVAQFAASFRGFDIPVGSVPSCVWVIPGTGRVPGILHRPATGRETASPPTN
jgi:hypothetical protein